MQNLQISDTFETRIVLKWLYPPRFLDKTGLPSTVQMLYWLCKKEQQNYGWFFRVAGGN